MNDVLDIGPAAPQDGGGRPDGGPRRRGVGWLWLAAAAALLGAVLAGLSTRDFVAHLDGQVHAIHCSVLPGAEAVVGASGCKEAMLSPWSSFFRTALWGGLPVSLLALGVFGFLAGLAGTLALRRTTTRRDTAFLLLGALVPVVASGVWGGIAASRLGTFCQTCVGMYVASALVLALAGVAHWRAPSGGQAPLPWLRWGVWAGQGALAVGLLAVIYAAGVPSERKSLEGCGRLVMPEDPKGVLIRLPGQGGAPALAVLDPLCPACRAFDQRLHLSGLDARLTTDVLLFPLDATCNWMVTQSLHPGACAVSEAMLCAPEVAPEILDWAFAEQERLLELGRQDAKAVRAEVAARFPAVKGCVGSAKARDRLTSSLRWAVDNALPVLTPQLYVDGTRICDEDTDLGLEYTLSRRLDAIVAAGGR